MAFSANKLPSFMTRRCAVFLSAMGILSGALLFSPQKASAFDETDINPAYNRPLSGILGSRFPAGSQDYSVGFFFDVTSDGTIANALGLSAQSNTPWVNPYRVSLWKYKTIAGVTAYNKLEDLLFTPGDPNLVPLISGSDILSYWLPLPALRNLENTGSAVDPANEMGYVLAAYGSYNEPDGNYLETGGAVTFNSPFVFDANGYNLASDPDFPIPVFLATDPVTGDPVYGYWNPSISVVPGPLPAVGVAVGFGWARKLRRRIKKS